MRYCAPINAPRHPHTPLHHDADNQRRMALPLRRLRLHKTEGYGQDADNQRHMVLSIRSLVLYVIDST